MVSFTRDPVSGQLTALAALRDIARDGDFAEELPVGLAACPDGGSVYASGQSDVDGRNFVARLQRDPANNGALSWDGGVRDGRGALACSADGAMLYGAADQLTAWAREADGALTALQFVDDSPGRVLALSRDDRSVYLAASTSGTVSAFARAADGRLTRIGDADSRLTSIDGLAVGPDGAMVYAVSARDSALSVLARYGDGRLGAFEVHRDGSGADGLAGASAVLASADGRFVYVAGAQDSAIAILHVDGMPLLPNGAPCNLELDNCATGICDFALSPLGDGPAGPIFPTVCCERLCNLDEACDDQGVCRYRF